MEEKNRNNNQDARIPEGVKGPGGKPFGQADYQVSNHGNEAKNGEVLHKQPGIAPDVLYIQVSSPERTLFDGEGKSVSSFNDHGPFDILPQHENFISVIQKGVVVYNQENSPQEFLLRNGVMRVIENRVDIFIGF